jgi:hypothetical protein
MACYRTCQRRGQSQNLFVEATASPRLTLGNFDFDVLFKKEIYEVAAVICFSLDVNMKGKRWTMIGRLLLSIRMEVPQINAPYLFTHINLRHPPMIQWLRYSEFGIGGCHTPLTSKSMPAFVVLYGLLQWL